ncbi:hypothetical protein Trco_005677, partial [Trichoderma cornu-damae]
MDAARLRQRSASHSSLRSQYRYQTRIVNYANPRPPARRRPLRSVNENVALLRSPGPLESMLKTTTETGDIGIFSIRPSSSSASFARPLRSKSHPREADFLRPAPSSGYDENYYCHPDDHKRLRSYRDTASEIISLYGSESQHTLLSSVSPASLEDDPRSYSMTTTSSKRIPSQKSTGTLQSQSSGSGFQRPRSPFPYPTRLKRPGVRPASPALRENGDIDYSRMVELDRFSQRTVHGSYKPTYAHGSRRPLPLSLRADANRSTSSLPSKTLHATYAYAPVPCQGRTPSSSMAWAPRQSTRHQRGSIDHSTRSASLTSIVEMYDRQATSNSNCAPIRATGSFYYDYSEQFEDQPPWEIDLDVPLHPIPQRAENIRRSLLLMDDIQGSFGIGGNDSDSIRSNTQEAEKSLMEPSHLSDAGGGNSERAEAEPPNPHDGGDAVAIQTPAKPNSSGIPLISVSDEEQDRPPSLKPNQVSPSEEAESADMLSMMSDSGSTRPNSSLEIPSKIFEANFDVVGDARSRQSSHAGVSKLRYSLDPALSDFASILSSFDRPGKGPLATDGEAHVRSASGGPHETSVYQQDGVGSTALKRPSGQLAAPLPMPDKIGTEEGEYKKGHRRNVAAMRISTAGVVPDDFVRSSPERQDDLPILSPEPISPAHELRVKESIPQLMKALPPLPREAEKLSGYGTAGIPPLSCYLAHEALLSGKGEPLGMERTSPAGAASGNSQDGQRKFKVKVRASSSSPCKGGDVACSVTTERPAYNASYEYGHSPAARPKLKLKLSSCQLGQIRPSQGEFVPYNNRLKQCNSLAELAPCPRKDVTDEKIDTATSSNKKLSSVDSNRSNSGTAKENPVRLEPSPQPSDQFNIPYPPSPVKVGAHPSSTTSMNGAALVETSSACPDRTPSGPAPTKDINATCEARASSKDQSLPPEVDKAEWRLRRWARDAKKAFR